VFADLNRLPRNGIADQPGRIAAAAFDATHPNFGRAIWDRVPPALIGRDEEAD